MIEFRRLRIFLLQKKQEQLEEEEEKLAPKPRYPEVPVIEDDDELDFEGEDVGKEKRKDEKLTGHSNNGLFEGMPYISQPLPDPDGEFDVGSAWVEGGGGREGGGEGGWNSNWNDLVEDGELYWGMGIVYNGGKFGFSISYIDGVNISTTLHHFFQIKSATESVFT